MVPTSVVEIVLVVVHLCQNLGRMFYIVKKKETNTIHLYNNGPGFFVFTFRSLQSFSMLNHYERTLLLKRSCTIWFCNFCYIYRLFKEGINFYLTQRCIIACNHNLQRHRDRLAFFMQ